MARRNRVARPPRREPVTAARRRLLVVCEGEVTEKQYLEEFKRWKNSPDVDIRIFGPAGDPVTLVQKAIELRDAAAATARSQGDVNADYDEVWCCFDVDLFGPRVAPARDQAKANGLRLAMSNPCFELWLLLHLRDSPGARGHHGMQDVWRELQPDVDDKHIDFDALKDGYEAAVRRAEKLEADAAAAGEPNREPTTEVFHLTNSIDEDGQAKRTEARRNRRNNDSSRAKAEAAAAQALAQANAEASDGAGDEGEQQ